MNVGIFSDCYLPTKNGVVTSILQSSEGLERRGHKVILVTVDTPHYAVKDSRVYGFPSLPFKPAIQVRLGVVDQRRIQCIVQHEQLDIIHTHTEFCLGWAAKRAARRLHVPLIHTAHTMYEAYRHYLPGGRWLPAGLIRTWLRLFLRGCAVLVCPSAKSQRYFRSFMPGMRSVVIGNGISRARFQPRPLSAQEKDQTRHGLGIQPCDKVVLYVGRMAPEKRAMELLNALAPLLHQHPHYKALFVGDGPAYGRMVRVAQANNLGQQVIFTGYVAWEHMYRLYSIAHIFVTASLSEVHPMTLIEASMCGLPIVARRDESYVDLIEENYNGYLADSDRQIAQRVAEILSDEAKLLKLSQNGLILSGKFDTENHLEKLESLYRRVMQNP